MWINLLIKSALFIALVPGVILRIPQGSSLLTQALVHGVVFAVVNWYVYKYVISQYENFEMPNSKVLPPCPAGSERHGTDCRMKGEGPVA